MPRQLQAISHTNLGDSAYEQIAGAIVSGRFEPGERLTIGQLAEMLGTSATPVRDAVKKLIVEGALIQQTPRHIRVPIITREHYLEIAAIRVQLEGLAAEKAAILATQDDLDRLRRNVEENKKAAKNLDWGAAMRLNKEFHFALPEIAKLPVLQSILESLWLQVSPPIAAYFKHEAGDMTHLHHVLIAAIVDRDSEKAKKAIIKDISGPIDGILKYLQTGS